MQVKVIPLLVIISRDCNPSDGHDDLKPISTLHHIAFEAGGKHAARDLPLRRGEATWRSCLLVAGDDELRCPYGRRTRDIERRVSSASRKQRNCQRRDAIRSTHAPS
jgi:hypothetical protein